MWVNMPGHPGQRQSTATGLVPQVSVPVRKIPVSVPIVATVSLAKRTPVLRALAIFLYCYGVILAPTAHQAFHHPDHIHRGESIVRIPDHDEPPHVDDHHDDHHAADDHDDDHHDAGDHDDPHHDGPPPSSDHEQGAPSLWHFGAVLGDDGNRVPTVTAGPSLVWIPDAPPTERPRTVSVPTPRLRGPPSVSSTRV